MIATLTPTQKGKEKKKKRKKTPKLLFTYFVFFLLYVKQRSKCCCFSLSLPKRKRKEKEEKKREKQRQKLHSPPHHHSTAVAPPLNPSNFVHFVQKKNEFTSQLTGKQNKQNPKIKKKVCSTRDSNVVTHHSTNLAHRCLTSEFGWARVLSPGYDRRQINMLVGSTSYGSKSRGNRPNRKKPPRRKKTRNKINTKIPRN